MLLLLLSLIILVIIIIYYPECLSTRRRHSQIRKEDPGASSFTCPAHTIDVCQDTLPSAAKWGNMRID